MVAVSLCIVTTKQYEPLCEHEELKPLKKLGIQPQVLRNPAVPGYVEGTSTLNTPEWELAFTPSMRYKVQYEPINAAICISHLRAIRQALGADHNWCIIMEEDANPTFHFSTDIISALLALSGSPTHADSVHEDPPAIIYFCTSQHAPRQQERVLNARTVWRANQHWSSPGQPELKNLTPNLRKRVNGSDRVLEDIFLILNSHNLCSANRSEIIGIFTCLIYSVNGKDVPT